MLDAQRFFIKEQVGFLKTVDVYDIFDPDTQKPLGAAREEIGSFKQILRWFISKKLMSTRIAVRTNDGKIVFTIHRPFRLFRAHVDLYTDEDEHIGYFKSKLFSLGGGLWVYDKDGKHFAEVKGDWKGWNFRFLTPEGTEMGVVTKKWAGLGKELFTSADNYIVAVNDDWADQKIAKILILGAALAIDVIFKEGDR